MLHPPPALADLRARIRAIEAGGTLRDLNDQPRGRPLGLTPLDRLLPAGLPSACLVAIETTETAPSPPLAWLVAALAAIAAQRSADHRGRRNVVLIDGDAALNPPVLSGLGLVLARTLLVRPRRGAEELSAVEEALGASCVAAVVAELRRPQATVVQRLARAAEAGGSLGVLVITGARETPPLPVVMRVERVAGSWPTAKVSLQRARGRPSGASIELSVNELGGSR